MLLKIKPLLNLFLMLVAHFTSSSFALSNEVDVLSDIAYGKFEKQTLDVYYPSVKTQNMPVIFMVHGGAWRMGDKASKSVVKNKVDYWVSKGFIFISVNYRMLPKIHPVEQAEDVEKALFFSQKNAYKWGGSPRKFILMGHSAGAHLVSLISVRQSTVIEPWLGTIALDSAAYDIEKIMNSQSPPMFYKKAFGKRPVYWKKASPIHRLANKIPPLINFSEWNFSVDLSETKFIQNQEGLPAFGCDCKDCFTWRRNYKDNLPEDLLNSLNRIGINLGCPFDCYGGNENLRVIFHFVGKIQSGSDSKIFNKRLNENILNYIPIRQQPWLSVMVLPSRDSFEPAPKRMNGTNEGVICIDMRLNLVEGIKTPNK